MKKDYLETKAQYKALERVLDRAYAQASEGKGLERHATNRSFEEQDIVRELEDMGTQGGIFQIRKKAKESLRLPTKQAVQEMLDIIVYASACVVTLEKKGGE